MFLKNKNFSTKMGTQLLGGIVTQNKEVNPIIHQIKTKITELCHANDDQDMETRIESDYKLLQAEVLKISELTPDQKNRMHSVY